MSNRVDLLGSFELGVPAERAFGLFTPRGEMEWVPGWDPDFREPASGELELDQVFTTQVGGESTIWTVVALDRDAFDVQYLRTTPGSRVARVHVSLEDTVDGCRVRVRYLCTALSASGAELLDEFARGFDAMLEGWRTMTSAHLDA